MHHTGFTSLRRGLIGAAALVVLLTILIAINITATNLGVRLDLTQEGLYSLSKGSRNILAELQEPVKLDFYFSGGRKDIPVELKDYARRVEDFLREYERAAGGKITLIRHDPQPDTDDEEWAQRYGLEGSQTGPFSPPIYFGLVGRSGKLEGVLPALNKQPEEALEYNITQLIHRITHPTKRSIGLISSLKVLGDQQPMRMPGQSPQPPQRPWKAFSDLHEGFDLQDLGTNVKTIDDNVDVIMVIHPKQLPADTVYAIDQYVLGGGHVILFVDPFSVVDSVTSPRMPRMIMQPQTTSDLPELLKAWGITYNPSMVVADTQIPLVYSDQSGKAIEDLGMLRLQKDNINAEDLTTKSLELITLAYAGSLSAVTTDKLKVTQLLKSTSGAGLTEATVFKFRSNPRENLEPPFRVHSLALQLQGTFETAFPDGRPLDPATGSDTNAPTPTTVPGRTSGKSTVVVIADVDFPFDGLCYQQVRTPFGISTQPMNDNPSLFNNLVDRLCGSEDLMSIRAKGTYERPFDRVEDLERHAQQALHGQLMKVQKAMDEANKRLSELAQQEDTSEAVISTELRTQRAAIEEELREHSREERRLRKQLRKDIVRLGNTVKAINIAGMPILIAVAGIAYGLVRGSRRTRQQRREAS